MYVNHTSELVNNTPQTQGRGSATPPAEATLGATGPIPSRPLTFQDAIEAVARLDTCTPDTRRGLQTALRQIAWSLTFIAARSSGAFLEDKKALDLSRIAFDIPAINRAWEGLRYGLAGFSSDKSYRNARWSLRRISRDLGLLTPPHRAPDLPPDHPYGPLLAAANAFELATARRFAAWLAAQGIHPHAVTDAELARYGDFLRHEMIGVNVAPMLRRVVRLWRRAGQSHPDWPQIKLAHAAQWRPVNPPFAVYPPALQTEIAAIRHWMHGTTALGPFHPQRHRRPLRPETVKLRLNTIRLILATYVAQGHDPSAITSLQPLLTPATVQAILQRIWEHGQARRQAMPDAMRDPSWNGNTNQLATAGLTLLMLAHYFDLPPETLQKVQALVKKVRMPPMAAMSRKNQARLDQFLNPVKLGLLLNLPQVLMREALQLRTSDPVEAARRARTAVFFALEIRIPLRMKNLHTCRLGHNLRFAGPGVPTASLRFQASETKNYRDLEFYVGARLCQILQTYIRHFLPVFAATSADFSSQQWLFPAGGGKPGPLSHSQVRNLIKTTVAERVGVVFHPHLFRALAVQISLEHNPGGLEHCRQLLGDKTLQTVLTHYAPIRTKEAADHQDMLVNAEADRLAALAAPRNRARRRQGGRS